MPMESAVVNRTLSIHMESTLCSVTSFSLPSPSASRIISFLTARDPNEIYGKTELPQQKLGHLRLYYRIRYACHLSWEASRSMLSWGRHVITRKGILSQPFPSILPYGTLRSMSHQYDPAFSKAKAKMPLSLCPLVFVSFWDVELRKSGMTMPTVDTRRCVMQIRADLIELIRLCRLVGKAMSQRPEDAKLAKTFGVMDLPVKK
ncbi:unnamed protein product [Dovyalis caffra]|uniref:Uncharacterized protein n=1 Tax=Dovyalis caffra TaxID=77055 RepID=A0AAV1QNC8_9ROSI|nr:unnamed protein product [Dovyalis caffra]CAK7324379.1 unnamed protein product [Dovyalis caffra]